MSRGADRFGLASSLPGPSGSIALGGGAGYMGALEDALPRLAQETELQKMLADEKMRSEQHKTNYQTLKAEHTRLQDEFVSLQNELRSTIEESRVVQEKYKDLLEKCRKELAAKHAEVEEVKGQALSDQKLDLLKLQMTEEVEKPFREKFQQQDQEVDHYRGEYNKLKYEYSFIKSEYEHEKQEHQRITDELHMRHEAEVTNLRKERELLASRQQPEGGADSQRMRVLQRENAQLHLKVKGLLTELEEIRAQREHMGLQSDHVTRLQSKQLAEHQANVKALETERESLRLQVDSLQKEISSTSELQTQLTSRTHELEKENIVLKNRAEEVTHKAKLDLTNLKMDMVRERGDLERDRDRLQNQIEDLKSQLEIVKHSMTQQDQALEDKERDAVKRVQAAREEEWQKLHQIENEKVEMETKLQEIERRKIDEEAHQHARRDKDDERVRAAVDAKDTAEKEALVLKTKAQHHQALMEQMERERSENAQLKTRLHHIETQYSSYVSNENELCDLNERLKHEATSLAAELQRAKEQLRTSRSDMDTAMAQNRAAWTEEKLNLQRRVDELEDQVGHVHQKLAGVITIHKKKKKTFSQLVSKMKRKMSVMHAKVEELEIEKGALQKAVPPETHLQLKKQLRDLTRRHREYRTILVASGLNLPGGDVTLTSFNVDNTLPNFSLLESQHHKDLALLKDRLDQLDDNQRHQLQEFKGISPIGTPRSKLNGSKSPRLQEDSYDSLSDKEN